MPFDLVWLAVPAYLVVQVVAITRTAGGMRLAAALPLVVMLPLFVYTAVAFAQESNLWPLGLLFLSPAALVYVTVIWLVGRESGDRVAT